MRDVGITITRLAFGLKKQVVVLSVFLFIYAAPAITGESVSTEKIAAEFREIRKVKGHFDGGKWNDDVDKWMGRKHRLMIELGTRLAKSPENDVLKLLGQPDQRVRKGDELFKRLTDEPGPGPPAAEANELLVYYWRGTHDLLFFSSVNGRIVHSGWWYAGE